MTRSRASWRPGPAGFWDKLDIRLDLDILEGRWKDLEWGPLKALLDYKEDTLYIKDAKGQVKNGYIHLKGYLMRGVRPEIQLSTHIKLEDQPAESVLAGLGLKGSFLEGSMNMETVLLMTGRNKKELISGMTGFSDIFIQNGVIKKSAVLLKTLNFLSLQKVFKKIPKDTKPR